MMKRDVRCFQMLFSLVLVWGAIGSAACGGCEPSWQPLVSGGQIGVANGDGSSAHVYSLVNWNDDLIVGGWFETAGGQSVNHIARWDGEIWHPLASGGQTGVDGAVFALTVWNDDLIAGGMFTSAGGQTVNRIARWDGYSWHPLSSDRGVGVDEGGVWALTVWNGDLIVGGKFAAAGGQIVNGIARWDGSEWRPLASGGAIGVEDGFVLALRKWNGDLVVGGGFQNIGDQSLKGIARWDGAEWFPFVDGTVAGVVGVVKSFAVWNGDLIVGGSFVHAGYGEMRRIARWDGLKWHPFPCTVGGPGFFGRDVKALAIWNNDIIAGGDLLAACGQPVTRVARWDGAMWLPFISDGSNGIAGSVLAVAVWKNDIIVGGQFASAGSQEANSIVRWGCATPIPGDINGDQIVNVVDLLAVINSWGACGDPNDCAADIAPPGPPQGDDQVNVQDLLFVINHLVTAASFRLSTCVGAPGSPLGQLQSAWRLPATIANT